MDVTKPYEFIGFGAMDVTEPYEFIRFGAMDVTKPFKFIRFGAMDVTKPYAFPTRNPATLRRTSRGASKGSRAGPGIDPASVSDRFGCMITFPN